jgi:hypothetical protein
MHYNQASIIYLFGFPYMVKIYKYAYRLNNYTILFFCKSKIFLFLCYYLSFFRITIA